jgi:hypothetical protein
VTLILAHSPQAKGRVERRHGVFQDRLVKALRLAKISDLAAANRFLDGVFLHDMNRRFIVPAKSTTDLHRRVPGEVRLERVLAYQEPRVVQNDWTVQWRGRWFQLGPGERSAGLARRRVLVIEQLDGQVVILFQGRVLRHEELPERPARVEAPREPHSFSRLGVKPAADHPWRTPARRPPPGPCSPGSTVSSSALRLANRGRATKTKTKKALVAT